MILLGILSDERAHRSKSPLMHNAVMRRHGVEGLYIPFVVRPEGIPDALRGIRALGFLGVNVTVPHKEAVVVHLDELSEEAQVAGAVNTVVNRDGLLLGENTDVSGFADALIGKGVRVEGASALVLGTGGAARAVLLGLRRLAAETIWVAGRDPQRARAVARVAQAHPLLLDGVGEVAPQAEILVNATAVSSRDEGPDLAALASGMRLDACGWVVDLNYGRPRNLWQEAARARGARFIDGVPMLAHQAAKSFTLWTGLSVDPEEYLEALGGDS